MLANIPILRGDYSVECAVIVFALLVVSLIRQQKFALRVLLLGVALFNLPLVALYIGDQSFAGQFPYDLVWHLSLGIIVVVVFGLCVRFLRQAVE